MPCCPSSRARLSLGGRRRAPSPSHPHGGIAERLLAKMQDKLRILEDLNMLYIRQIALSLEVLAHVPS